LVKDRHGEDNVNIRDSQRRQATLEQDLLEADKENEKLSADLSVLESQMLVLQGALTVLPACFCVVAFIAPLQVAAAERDEILAKHDRADAAHASSDARIDELHAALVDAQTLVRETSLERDEIEKAAQMAAQAAAKNESAMRIHLDNTLAENTRLRETTVASESAKADAALMELQQLRVENDRLDAENVQG